MRIDQSIIEGCIAGKRKAQSQLYDKFSAGMLGICLRYCKNLEDAEDVLQEGFIKVFRSIQTFRGESSIGAWIKRIMINTAITHIKKQISIGNMMTEMIDSIEMEESENEEIVLAHIDPQKLLGFIQELPEGYRTVLNLYVFEGYTHKEIAESLSISESTSKTQLFKARKYLRNKIEPVSQRKIMVK
jgi:RNA polymerase sigma factor (sigma-70 family)